MTTDLPALDTYDAEIVTLTGYYSLRIAEAEEAAASARQALTTAEATLAELTSERANAVHQARERLLTATGAEIRDGGIRGKPGRPTRRVEPPALVLPTPEPILANLVNDAERGLAASGVPIDGHTPDGVPFGSGAAGGGVVLVWAERPTSPVSVAPTAAEEAAREVPRRGVLGVTPERLIAAVTGHAIDGEIADASAADAFTDAVSEPERSLYEQGFSREEVATTPIAEQWRLKRENVNHIDVHQIGGGLWIEPGAAVSAAGEDCPF